MKWLWRIFSFKISFIAIQNGYWLNYYVFIINNFYNLYGALAYSSFFFLLPLLLLLHLLYKLDDFDDELNQTRDSTEIFKMFTDWNTHTHTHAFNYHYFISVYVYSVCVYLYITWWFDSRRKTISNLNQQYDSSYF